MEKLYKIYYGDTKEDYIKRYLKEEDVLDGYLSEAKAFDIFFTDMIMCNNYLQKNYEYSIMKPVCVYSVFPSSLLPSSPIPYFFSNFSILLLLFDI